MGCEVQRIRFEKDILTLKLFFHKSIAEDPFHFQSGEPNYFVFTRITKYSILGPYFGGSFDKE